jgi:formate/nitrite transporter FocA (FNT family)
LLGFIFGFVVFIPAAVLAAVTDWYIRFLFPTKARLISSATLIGEFLVLAFAIRFVFILHQFANEESALGGNRGIIFPLALVFLVFAAKALFTPNAIDEPK